MTKGPRIERVVYDSWRDGFTSRLRVLGKNTKEYTCTNMQVYDNGTLGVRPFWRLQNTTNLVASDTIDNQAFIAWRPSPSNSEGELWMHGYSNDVWIYDLAAGTWAAGGASIDAQITASDNHGAAWGTTHDWDSSGNLVGSAQYSTLPTDNWIFGGEAKIDEADAVTAITWTDVTTNRITNFVLYRDRIWGWHNANPSVDPGNRLYYTDAGSYTLSSAGNFFDIGAASDGFYILGVWAVRDSLLIAMSNGDWYVFTGTPGSGSLRFIGNYVTPAHGAAGAVLNNAVYFIAPYGRQVSIATPSGVDTVSLSHIRPFNGDIRWTIFHDYRALSSQQEQSLLLPTLRNNSDQWFAAIEFVNGSWTYTGFGKDRFSDSSSNIGILRDCAVIAEGKAYAFMMEDPDDPGSHELQLYTRDIVLNRPSRKTDEWSDSKEVAAGDTATGLSRGGVRLAPFSPEGLEVRVRQVIVDFHYWKDTDNDRYEDPDMRCVLLDGGRLGTEVIDSFSASALPTFEDESLPEDTVLGLPYRWVFRFPLEDNDFRISQQVQIDDMISVAIDRIVVDYEVRPDNHWGGQQGGT